MASRKGGENEGADGEKVDLAEGDLEALDSFCSGFGYEEMSFDDWAGLEKSLDLVVELEVPTREAIKGGKRFLEYTRSVVQEEASGQATKREKIVQEIEIPPRSKNLSTITLEGFGDKCGNMVGDLKVIIILK